MIAVEIIRHRLSIAIRIDDHFTGLPVGEALDVSLDTGEPAVRAIDRGGYRHADGTYRFAGLADGPRQVRVAAPGGERFTWTSTTAVTVPLADPRLPVVIASWPSPSGQVAAGLLAIRGALLTAAAGQEVVIEPVTPPLFGRFTRCDAAGEFLFVLAGPVRTDATTGLVELRVTVPARAVSSIDVVDGLTTTSFSGDTFTARPGRETRARINLI